VTEQSVTVGVAMSERSSAPAAVLPMRATPGPVPDDPGWAFEFAWDGVRSLAEVGSEYVRLVGRSTRSVTSSYPELAVLPALTRRPVLLDGKIVALDACGRPSLSRLQCRMNLQRPSAVVLARVPVVYYVFDLLRLDDRCTLQLPYLRRRELLEELGLTGGPLVLSPYFLDIDGQAMLDTAAQYGLPGVVAKRADSPYQPGRRSRSWVQTALRRTQEVVIGGWVPGKRGPAGALGSLLVGLPTEAGLRYAGQVCLGFTDAARRELPDRLTGLARHTSPFADQLPPETVRNAQWVAPTMLGEVSYQRWTRRGRLAQPSWIGLRRGKHPAAVQSPVVLAPALPGVPADPAQVQVDQGELAQALALARAEVREQRIQISPHFLYNALSAISVLVRTDPLRARELLMEFAGFTRYCFRSDTRFTTLADEMENIERYLALEQARLEERLAVTIQVAPQVLAVVLPFLVLQSVVESAVYGIEEIPGGGTVAISAVDAGADCLITVAADGPDSPAQADLRGVDDRLRSAFGDGYGLAVDAIPGGGTTVSLRVPTLHPAPS